MRRRPSFHTAKPRYSSELRARRAPEDDPQQAQLTTARIRRAAALVGGCGCLGLAMFAQASRPAEPWDVSVPAGEVLKAVNWPETFPLTAAHLRRLDESDDSRFYAEPRIVQHIDDYAIRTIGEYYARVLPKGGAVLDLMSSWTSHLAEGAGKDKADGHFHRVSGLGMHEDELSRNTALHDYHVHDLNKSPKLPMYADRSFDAIFCSVSVDYLANPLPIFAELHRVLKPGGLAVRDKARSHSSSAQSRTTPPRHNPTSRPARSLSRARRSLPGAIACSPPRPSLPGVRLASPAGCGSVAATFTFRRANGPLLRASISALLPREDAQTLFTP